MYNKNLHNRKSIRLKGYDYSKEGLYFITLCTQNREYLFGKIQNKIMLLNHAGKIVENEFINLLKRFAHIQLHEYVIMPNHFHCIIEILENNNIKEELNNKKTVGDIVGAFKSIVTVKYIYGVKNYNWKPFNKKLWQRNYWEHIIRNEKSYNKILDYIKNNPTKWHDDKLK